MKRAHEMPFGAAVTPTACAFRLWAPRRNTVELGFGDLAQTAHWHRADRRDADGWFALERPRREPGDALPLSHRRRAARARPGVALQPRRRARRRARSSIPHASTGTTATGAAGRGTRRSSTSCTSARSRARGTFAACDRATRLSGRARHHRDRADAAGRLSGRAQLGLRRRAAVCARRGLRRAGRPEALVDAAHGGA